MFLFAAALALQSAVPWIQPTQILSPDAVKSRIAACGIDVSRISMVAKYGGEDVAEISGGKASSERRLACIARLSLTVQDFVEFKAGPLQRRYSAIYDAIAEETNREAARSALRRHGLLDQLPSYYPKSETLITYAGRLEKLCGLPIGSYLAVAAPSLLTINTPTLATALDGHGRKDDPIMCVVNAITASNLRDYGVSFGFVGNASGKSKTPK